FRTTSYASSFVHFFILVSACIFFPFSLLSSFLLRHFPSFPTRRSSDLASRTPQACGEPFGGAQDVIGTDGTVLGDDLGACGPGRSEEHTSELQSRFELVCRLLLEKKNKTI